MPAKQPFRSKRLIEVPRRIEHHFDNAFDTAVHDVGAGHVHAQTARDRRADLRRVELLPFDFAALDCLFRQSLEGGLLLKREPERLGVPSLDVSRGNSNGSSRLPRPSYLLSQQLSAKTPRVSSKAWQLSDIPALCISNRAVRITPRHCSLRR